MESMGNFQRNIWTNSQETDQRRMSGFFLQEMCFLLGKDLGGEPPCQHCCDEHSVRLRQMGCPALWGVRMQNGWDYLRLGPHEAAGLTQKRPAEPRTMAVQLSRSSYCKHTYSNPILPARLRVLPTEQLTLKAIPRVCPRLRESSSLHHSHQEPGEATVTL